LIGDSESSACKMLIIKVDVEMVINTNSILLLYYYTTLDNV
jgi:hypothetical protein